MEDLAIYDKLRQEAGSYYNTIGNIYSPIFKQKVVFSSEGFNHIVYKRARTERERSSQILRFKLLPLAYKLIGIATTFQEYEEIIRDFNVKRHKKRVSVSQTVRYWGIIGIIDGRKIKVILRRISNGNFHFWSIVPDWTTNKYRDTKFITTMKGNPEED